MTSYTTDGWTLRWTGGNPEENYYGGLGNIFVAAADVSADADATYLPLATTTEGIVFTLPAGTYEIILQGLIQLRR